MGNTESTHQRLFPYFCERCDARVQLSMRLVGELGSDVTHAGATIACHCTSEPLATSTHNRPEYWLIDFDEVMQDAQ